MSRYTGDTPQGRAKVIAEEPVGRNPKIAVSLSAAHHVVFMFCRAARLKSEKLS